MYPLYNPEAEKTWLHQIAETSRNQEKAIAALQDDTERDAGRVRKLSKWKEAFAHIRKLAENKQTIPFQGGFSHVYATPYLLQQSHRLHYDFSRFMQKHLLEGSPLGVPAVSDEGGGEHETAEAAFEGNGTVKHLRPVPIGEHTLPPLPYAYDALEPYIDEKTMRLHHDKHHRSYVDGLNKAEREMAKARQSGNFSLIKHWEREAAFHGAGHYLHTIFWGNMKPKGGGPATGAIAREINRTFGSFHKFKRHFSSAANNVEAVGWALLVWAPRAHRVEILQAEKHQNLSQQDVIPLLVLDVWEHAYYLKYHNDRKAYIKAWWHVVNWDDVEGRFQQARKVRWQPF